MIKFEEIVRIMTNLYDVNSYLDNEIVVEDDKWFDCPNCGDLILEDDYCVEDLLEKDETGATYVTCPICKEKMYRLKNEGADEDSEVEIESNKKEGPMVRVVRFEIPKQVKYWDDDSERYVGGIGIDDYIVCGCCGGIVPLEDIYESAEESCLEEAKSPIIIYDDWINISEEIVGE